MNAYILIIALLCKAVALERPLEHCDVGTVLFSRSSLNQRTWTLPQIGLLRARKYLLDILPPVHVLNIRSEDFSDSMLCYFKESFEVVNREAPDHETNTLMKIALSDAVGGYLKMWVLPITKFAYYGGTIPKQDALKVYKLHDDIKKYLNTDGKGWHKPTTSFLYSMSVNIAPIHQDHARNTEDPCSDIAYFEKTNTGLAIPVPSISWEQGAECMFLPLKNQGPVPLTYPNTSDMLFRYYNTAKLCIMSSNIDDMESYDERLQRWLDQNIVPHLNDDTLYPAFHSVLSLVNKSRNVFEFSDSSFLSLNFRNKTRVAGIPVDLSSKKIMIITVIILLEIAWCIPTLCYLICTKIRKNKVNPSEYYVGDPPRSDGDFQGGWTCSATTTNGTKVASKQISASPSTRSQACLSTLVRNYDADVNARFPKASEHSIGTATHTDFTSQLHPVQIKMHDQATARVSSRQFHEPVTTNSTPAYISVSNADKNITRPCWKRSVYSSTPSKTSMLSCISTHRTNKKSSPVFKTCKCNCTASSSFLKPCTCDCTTPTSSFTKSCKCNCETPSYNSPCSECKISASQAIKTYRCDTKKKASSSFIKSCCCDSNCECFNSIPEEELMSASGSLITVQNLQPIQTVTLLHDSVSSINQTNTLVDEKITPETRSKKSVTIADVDNMPLSNKLKDRKKTCREMQSIAIEKASKQTMKNSFPKLNQPTVGKESRASRKNLKSQKVKTSKPLLQITIDKQRFRSLNNPPTNTVFPASPAKAKPSKIPKRFFTSCVTQTPFPPKKLDKDRKSLIPQPKRQLTVDDIIIKSSKTCVNNKLNMTL